MVSLLQQINNIIPKIQANFAEIDDALLLDMDGYVCEASCANIFLVDNEGILHTPPADHCSPGIARDAVLMSAKELDIRVQIRRLTLAELYVAKEVFTTDTLEGLTPVTMIDGRCIGNGECGEVTIRFQAAYEALYDRPGYTTEIPPFA